MSESKTMTNDPICGMTVDESIAFHTEIDGKVFYFCSDTCKQKFMPAPDGANQKEKSGGCCG